MPHSKPTVIITGAGGFLGHYLVDYFVASGWQVRALVHRPSDNQSRPGVTYYPYDITKPFDTAAIFSGADYLVHAAYIKSNTAHPAAFSANVSGAKALLTASRQYKLQKNVFISSMSAHAQAESVYGKQKLAIEAMFNSSKDVVLRPGLIVGDGGIVKQMAQFMKTKHAVPLIGGGKQPLQIIALDDLIQVIVQALSLPLHGVFTVATPTVYSYKQFYQALAAELHTPVVYIPVPFFALLGTLQLVARLRVPLSVSTDNALGLKQLRAVDNARDMTQLQVEPRSLEQALASSHI